MPPCMGRSKSSLLYLINGSPDSCGLECCWEPAHSWPLSVHKVNAAHRGKPSHSERTRFSSSHIWKKDDQDMITRQSREPKNLPWLTNEALLQLLLAVVGVFMEGWLLLNEIDFLCSWGMLPLFSILLELEAHQDLSQGTHYPLPESLFCSGGLTAEWSKLQDNYCSVWIQVHSRVFLQVSKEGAKQSCKDLSSPSSYATQKKTDTEKVSLLCGKAIIKNIGSHVYSDSPLQKRCSKNWCRSRCILCVCVCVCVCVLVPPLRSTTPTGKQSSMERC